MVTFPPELRVRPNDQQSRGGVKQWRDTGWGWGSPSFVTGQADNGTTYTNLGKSYAQLLPAPPLATACMLSRFNPVRLSVSLWTVVLQAPQSMGFSRQEYWSGLPYPPPRNLPDPGIKPASLISPALAGRFFTTSATWEAHSPVTSHWSLVNEKL